MTPIMTTKRQFTDFIKLHGGTTRYSGGAPQPELEEPQELVHTVVAGRQRVGNNRYRKKFITVGMHTRRKFIGMTPSKGKIMYVHGFNSSEEVDRVRQAWGDTPVPFNVIFQ